MSFEPLKRILTRSVTSVGQQPQLVVARVFAVCELVLQSVWGEEQAETIRPVSFKEGALKLETGSPAAKQQFAVDMIRLKNEINRQLGSQVVKKIIIQSKGF